MILLSKMAVHLFSMVRYVKSFSVNCFSTFSSFLIQVTKICFSVLACFRNVFPKKHRFNGFQIWVYFDSINLHALVDDNFFVTFLFFEMSPFKILCLVTKFGCFITDTDLSGENWKYIFFLLWRVFKKFLVVDVCVPFISPVSHRYWALLWDLLCSA